MVLWHHYLGAARAALRTAFSYNISFILPVLSQPIFRAAATLAMMLAHRAHSAAAGACSLLTRRVL